METKALPKWVIFSVIGLVAVVVILVFSKGVQTQDASAADLDKLRNAQHGSGNSGSTPIRIPAASTKPTSGASRSSN